MPTEPSNHLCDHCPINSPDRRRAALAKLDAMPAAAIASAEDLVDQFGLALELLAPRLDKLRAESDRGWYEVEARNNRGVYVIVYRIGFVAGIIREMILEMRI